MILPTFLTCGRSDIFLFDILLFQQNMLIFDFQFFNILFKYSILIQQFIVVGIFIHGWLALFLDLQVGQSFYSSFEIVKFFIHVQHLLIYDADFLTDFCITFCELAETLDYLFMDFMQCLKIISNNIIESENSSKQVTKTLIFPNGSDYGPFLSRKIPKIILTDGNNQQHLIQLFYNQIHFDHGLGCVDDRLITCAYYTVRSRIFILFFLDKAIHLLIMHLRKDYFQYRNLTKFLFYIFYQKVYKLTYFLYNIHISRYISFMSASKQDKNVSLTAVEKYGLKFYSFIISQLCTLSLLLTTRSVPLALAFVSFYNVIGNYLPIKVDKEREKYINKIQNNNKYLLGPLIASCLSTPIILYALWRNYDNFVGDSVLELIPTLFVCGFMISGSIDASHQLLHRTQYFCKFFSYLNLFFLQFTIYPTEHLYLHHKKVGTKQDPITSPKNKTVYSFYVNALFSCYKFNYNYSKKIFVFNLASTIGYNLLAIGLAIKEGSSLNKALFFSLLSYFTLFIMEAVEYMEHYGLVYRADEKSKPVSEVCSWNTSESQFLNWNIFRFQRHSDHHMNAYKLYPTLNLDESMPQLPFDFISGIVMCLFSPLWFKLMNPLADQVVSGQKVSEGHKSFVNRSFTILKYILVALFPLRLIEYIVLTSKM